jgi:hypothetical protein
MNEHERASRPVLFRMNDSEYPYWGRGSSLFVSSDQNVYWITARHVIEKQGASAHDLLITPSDESAVSVPFNELIQIEKDPDNADFRGTAFWSSEYYDSTFVRPKLFIEWN